MAKERKYISEYENQRKLPLNILMAYQISSKYKLQLTFFIYIAAPFFHVHRSNNSGSIFFKYQKENSFKVKKSFNFQLIIFINKYDSHNMNE